jgi:protein-S-isoprenylcysteine O-methyltransferase Ste14
LAREKRRADRPGPHLGGLVVATIFIVIGLGVFFPELPWSMFWGALVILLGVWIAYLWTQRPHGNRPESYNTLG